MKIFFPKKFKSKNPIKIYDYQHLTLILFSSQIIPEQFDVEKLRSSIPGELTKPIVQTSSLLQFIFRDKITINVEIGKISFLVKITKDIAFFSEVINKFLLNFTNYKWQSLRLLLKRFISFPSNIIQDINFINNYFLNQKKTLDINGINPQKIRLNFRYLFPNSTFNIAIEELYIKLNDRKKPQGGLFFRGIFNYNLIEKLEEEKLIFLSSIVTNIQGNIDIFNDIIDDNFLYN